MGAAVWILFCLFLNIQRNQSKKSRCIQNKVCFEIHGNSLRKILQTQSSVPCTIEHVTKHVMYIQCAGAQSLMVKHFDTKQRFSNRTLVIYIQCSGALLFKVKHFDTNRQQPWSNMIEASKTLEPQIPFQTPVSRNKPYLRLDELLVFCRLILSLHLLHLQKL